MSQNGWGEKLDLKMVLVAMLGVLCWDYVHIICVAYQKLPWHPASEDREDIDMKHVARLLPASSRSHVAAKNLLSALQKYPEDPVRDVEVQRTWCWAMFLELDVSKKNILL